jgi:uronate dehydrogenase
VRILLTGAAGNIGAMLRPRLARPGRVLRLLDTAALEAGPGEEVVRAAVTDRAALAAATRDVDAVVHLAGISGEAPWADVLAVNVDGTQAVLAAAQEAGVPRVVLASSNHAVGYLTRADAPVPDDAPARPDTFYGWSKAAIESLGRLYHDRFGTDVVCLRIGSCFARPTSVRGLAGWLSPDDAGRLVEAALSPAAAGYHVVWGVSANTRRWWSAEGGAAIGFHPRDDSEAFAADVADDLTDGMTEDPADEFLGGDFCAHPLGTRRARTPRS